MWNRIVAAYKKNLSKNEDIVQNTWEVLFSTVFNYANSEIDDQRHVQMGSTKRADIVITNGSEDLFVVELKRHNLKEKEGRAQLFSYLNQIKMNLGVLVCDKLYIYDFDYTAKTDNFSALEIPFVENNPDGIRFVELFSKGNFDEQKIKAFIAESNSKKNDEKEIRSSITSDFVKNLLKKHLSENHPTADIEKILSEYSFDVVRKQTSGNPVAGNPVPPPTPISPRPPKDNTQYTLDGIQTGGKGSTVYATVKKYVDQHPGISFSELQKEFPDDIAKPATKMIRKWEDVSQKEWDGNRFNKTPIVLSDGKSGRQEVAVSTQWTTVNMGKFIKRAALLGMVIKPIP